MTARRRLRTLAAACAMTVAAATGAVAQEPKPTPTAGPYVLPEGGGSVCCNGHREGIYNYDELFNPNVHFNGYKVYLSSPRHKDSGYRGECRNPGNEENVNGRIFNWEAAQGGWNGTTMYTDGRYSLIGRGYKVTVSKNTRDNGFLANRDASRNWGSNLHVVTHTNASSGCASSPNYLATMFGDPDYHKYDKALATRVGAALDPVTPGTTWRNVQAGWAELGTNASRGDAYVEVQFHDNTAGQSWMYNTSKYYAFRYGIGIDAFLGSPR